jgi:Na+-transporting NADH:ubiquinone oxidoreductase subunit C
MQPLVKKRLAKLSQRRLIEMNKYVRMLAFVAILGGISGGLLTGSTFLTNALIEANKEARLKSEILQAHGVEFTAATIHTVFENNVSVYTYTRPYAEADFEFKFYVDQVKGYITYRFDDNFGRGVWGPIIGLFTLESDWSTIVRIAILQQEETPGLGAIVATRNYLNQFVGKQIGLGDDALKIVKDLDLATATDYQVPSISGATGTSGRFQSILNNAYAAYRTVWEQTAQERL